MGGHEGPVFVLKPSTPKTLSVCTMNWLADLLEGKLIFTNAKIIFIQEIRDVKSDGCAEVLTMKESDFNLVLRNTHQTEE